MVPLINLTKSISNDKNNDKSTWLKWSQDDLANWLKEQLEERKQVFFSDPDELIASFNREKSHAREYHGRELLELVQNADDSGVDFGPNKLLIQLTDEALFVANTGIPFSPEGIKSLMVSNISPKQFLRTKCIGYKGLGFRSVLGWASTIMILSGKLSIGFNKSFATDWLRGLRIEKSMVDTKLKTFEKKSGILNPISTLSVPYLFLSENIDDKIIKNIYKKAKGIFESGYDTVVCIVFQNPNKTKEQVQKQINTLNSQILLFLQYLEKIEIQSPDKNECWEVKRKENEIVVNPNSDNKQHWKLFKIEDDIPEVYLKPEQILEKKFEIKLAIPSQSVEHDKLFVYFPTEVLFPFTLIAHATFEVGGNRQNLIKSDVNAFIAEKLADLMAKAAEEIKEDYDNPWYALYSISPRGSIDPVLNELEFFGENEDKNFLDILKDKIRKYALLPVRNGKFETPETAKRIKGNFDSLLTGELFKDLCIHTSDNYIIKLLNELNVNYIDYDDLRERINQITDGLSMEKRAQIIYLFIEHDLINHTPPELLLDENGDLISHGSTVILPSEGRTFSLPSWVPQRIINSELTTLLRNKFEVTRVRDLVTKLKPFNVQEYNMISLVSSIVAGTNNLIYENPDNELELRKQMMRVIWNLYTSIEERVVLPDRINVILPTRGGKYQSARKLYLGKEYKNGQILEYLYAHIDSDIIVSDPINLGFSETSDELENFLCWIGVSLKPRIIEKNINDDDFFEYILSTLAFPSKFKDIFIDSSEELKKYNTRHTRLEKFKSIDRLEEIIDTADPHAILCMIVTMPEIDIWRMSGDNSARIELRRPSQQNWRNIQDQKIPSYPIWLLKTKEWLQTSSGDSLPPTKCSLAKGVRDFSPIIGFPAINFEHPLIVTLNLDRTALRNALTTVGVVSELDDLSWDSYYKILLELPNMDSDGKKAKSVYRTLISRTDTDQFPSGKKYEEFMDQGKMFGKLGEETKYYPIQRLYYLENLTLPEHIVNQFPILELDGRRGAAKVRDLFGVDQLTWDKINVKITKFDKHSCSENFNSEIERLKEYIYALRAEEDTNRRALSILKRLEIILCKSVKGSITVNGEVREIELNQNDSISDKDKVYLVSEPTEYNVSLLKDEMIADAVGEIIENYLKIDIKDKIARLATCSVERRDELLDRITGGSGKERLERTKALFDREIETEEEFPKPTPWEPPKREIEVETTEPKDEDREKGETYSEEIGEVTVSSEELPDLLSSKIARRVSLNPIHDYTSTTIRFIDPDKAENLAMKFEEAQGRYPKKISHFRGSESFGCDLISFRNKDDFNDFEKTNNFGFIIRFIEVKGRSSEKGSLTLKGNELICAQKHRKKYFMYRIFKDEDKGIFKLIEIGDPLGSESEALKPQYDVNPFRSQKSKYWKVKEIEEDFKPNSEDSNYKEGVT